MEYEFTVVIEKDEDGMFIAICPALLGCATAGETREEAIEMIKDAMRLHIQDRRESGEPINEEVCTERICVSV